MFCLIVISSTTGIRHLAQNKLAQSSFRSPLHGSPWRLILSLSVIRPSGIKWAGTITDPRMWYIRKYWFKPGPNFFVWTLQPLPKYDYTFMYEHTAWRLHKIIHFSWNTPLIELTTFQVQQCEELQLTVNHIKNSSSTDIGAAVEVSCVQGTIKIWAITTTVYISKNEHLFRCRDCEHRVQIMW